LKTRVIVCFGLMLASLLVLSSCAKASYLRPGYLPPQEAADRYHNAIRWRDYETAKMMIAPRSYAAFDRFVDENRGTLNVSEYKIGKLVIKDRGNKAEIKVERTFFMSSSMKEQKEELLQTWYLIDGKWCLSGPPF